MANIPLISGSQDLAQLYKAVNDRLVLLNAAIQTTTGVLPPDGSYADINVSGAGTVWTVTNQAITNAKLADMAQATVKGRASGAGTGAVTDLSAAQLTAIVSVGGAALTKTNDTNVTLTLGGTPTTALLAATSLTLGWTGTLAASRGGTGLSALGTGVATWLGTPSSANLAAALTDETGSGPNVFATAPTFTNSIQLGTISSVTGALKLANSASINLTTIQAGNAAAAITYTWPTNVGAAGTFLTDVVGNGMLSWATPAGSGGLTVNTTSITGGTTTRLLYDNAGTVGETSGVTFPGTGQITVNSTMTLGTVSSATGMLKLANSASANLTTIQAGNAANARTYIWPTDFGAAGTVLTDAAGNGTLSWAPSSVDYVTLIDQTFIDTLVDNDVVYVANGATIDTCTLTGLTFVKFIFQPGLVTVNGPITLTGCTRIIFEGDWTTLGWGGLSTDTMWTWEHTQYCEWKYFYIVSAPSDPMDGAFRSISRVGGGQVSTHNVFQDVFVDGTNTGGLNYGWRIGVEGDANGDNDDFHMFTRCTVANYDICAYSIEQPEAKFITFHDCGFSGNGFGQYGVSTGLNSGLGGSFLFQNGGGGGNTESDFFLGAPDDLIVIQGCQLESSNRVLDMTSATSSSWPVHIRDCRISTDALDADNKVIIYRDRGPLMLTNCSIEAFSKAVEINLAATGRCQGIAIGCSINSTLDNPFTSTNVANGQWLVYGTTKGVDGADFVPWPMVIPVLTFAELPVGMMSAGLIHITDSPVDIPGAEITAGGGGNDVLAWCNDGDWFVVGSAGLKVPTTITVANEATDTSCFLGFFTDTTGDLGPKTNTNLAFNSNTGLLTLGADVTVVGTLAAPITQNSQSTAYTTVLADAGKHIFHPTADNNPRTFTIAANGSVAYPVGTTITFVNQINTVTIAITSDTLTLAGAGTTGSRTLAANGIATALKVASTSWIISGTGLT